MPKRTASYKDWAAEKLKNPKIATAYLVAASRESLPALLKALRKVAEAHQMPKVAKTAGVQRESLYRMLSETGNPEANNLWNIAQAMGFRFILEPILEPEHAPGTEDLSRSWSDAITQSNAATHTPDKYLAVNASGSLSTHSPVYAEALGAVTFIAGRAPATAWSWSVGNPSATTHFPGDYDPTRQDLMMGVLAQTARAMETKVGNV
ncbi:MAG: DNA-binding protein [Bryobacteraceae bacterium]|jgi:probable addiction module antidote protein